MFFPALFLDVYKRQELKKKKILFVAGGVGTAPVYPQVKWLHEHGVDCDVIMGSRNKDLLILEDEMKKVATNLYVTTDDGSYGFKGTGTAQLQELWDNGNRYDHCVATVSYTHLDVYKRQAWT